MTREEARTRLRVASEKFYRATGLDVMTVYLPIIQRHVCDIAPHLDNVRDEMLAEFVADFERVVEASL